MVNKIRLERALLEIANSPLKLNTKGLEWVRKMYIGGMKAYLFISGGYYECRCGRFFRTHKGYKIHCNWHNKEYQKEVEGDFYKSRGFERRR